MWNPIIITYLWDERHTPANEPYQIGTAEIRASIRAVAGRLAQPMVELPASIDYALSMRALGILRGHRHMPANIDPAICAELARLHAENHIDRLVVALAHKEFASQMGDHRNWYEIFSEAVVFDAFSRTRVTPSVIVMPKITVSELIGFPENREFARTLMQHINPYIH